MLHIHPVFLQLTPDVDISDSSKHSPPLVDWQAAREWILRLLFLSAGFSASYHGGGAG